MVAISPGAIAATAYGPRMDHAR